MKKILALLLSSFALSAYAADLPVVDADTKKEIIEYCKETAEDESVAAADLQKFMLKCVNKELESEGFAPVKKLKN